MKKLLTVYVFSKISTKRFFRDKLAIFFTIIFPLIFLFVFGGLFGEDSGVTFKIAMINQSESEFSEQYIKEAHEADVFDIDDEVQSLDQAKEKMNRGELDASVILPPDFGEIKNGQHPSGEALIYYTQNSQQAGQTLATLMDAQFKEINSKFIKVEEPFTVKAQQTNDKGLSQFDYTFSGLLGFSIIGLGIFGPVNVFPELKKQGVLRRLHTTPLRVWQYFTSTAVSQVLTGLLSIAISFVVAITVFDLKLSGNIFELIIFLTMSITMILGIGLALGGWAKNERQAAPLANIVVFPMMFLSGTFFPRFLMPEWLQNISAFLPLTPVIDGIRLIATEGKHLSELGPQLGMITVWGIVIYIIAFRVFRWE